jgi:biopolymer transport protein ExbD
MPKVKVPRKSTAIDMTAMTDVAFLLLTFFMLTTKFKPDEPVRINTPSSISQIILPDRDIIQILISADDKVYFEIDGQFTRIELLERMGEKYQIQFTEKEKNTFALVGTIGIPVNQLKQYLNLDPDARKKVVSPGIPCDSTRNELGDWIHQARLSNPAFRVAIKGDSEASYPVVKQVIATLQDKKVNKFNFITSQEQPVEK